MTPRGTLGLCCVFIAQLMTHPAICTLPFTLQVMIYQVMMDFIPGQKLFFLYLFVFGTALWLLLR